MKGLPIGLDNFQDFNLLESTYIDKTEYIYKLLNTGGKTFFLSRPRRFGKSLLLSTIKAVFEGKKELFKGLYIEDKIDWEEHSVITLDMSKNTESLQLLKQSLANSLRLIALVHREELNYQPENPSGMLEELITKLFVKTGKQVVVLVDEYDKPILDVIDNPELALAYRQFLQNFYIVLKSSSSKIRFLMLTGVSKINQLSIFSGLNNLSDITLDTEYAGICGYTQQELEKHFPDHIKALSDNYEYTVQEALQRIQFWYNGYSWDGKTFVYNPFSVLLLFQRKIFLPFWFNTGTPIFLIKLLEKRDNLETALQEEINVPISFSDGQSLENLDTIALMFQAGYLTIKSLDTKNEQYSLKLPNEEVKRSLSEYLLADFSGQPNRKVHELVGQIKKVSAPAIQPGP